MARRFKLFNIIFTGHDEIILRDYLALERTKLANERTFLSYIRSSIYMFLGGITFLQLWEFRKIRWLGVLTLASGVALLVVGTYRYLLIRYRLKQYYSKNGVGPKELPDQPE